MATCAYCNSQLESDVKFCPNCGAALPVEAPPQPSFQNDQPAYHDPSYQQPYEQQAQQPYQQSQTNYGNPAINDSGSIGWGILGFFLPIIGLVLFLVWKNTKPNSAKVAGIGAIIGFVLNLATLTMGVI